MTTATEIAPPNGPTPPNAVGATGAIETAMPLAACEVAFERARQENDFAGMAAALRTAWGEVGLGSENLDPDAATVAWGMREAFVAARSRWDQDHRMRPRPETVGIQQEKSVAQGPNGEVRYVRWSPALARGESESDVNPVPIVVLGGFGTDPESTMWARRTLCVDGARHVIGIDDATSWSVGPGEEPIHENIDSFFNERARNLLAVIEQEANGDPNYQVDLVVQSGALQGIAAALEEVARLDGKMPPRIRSIILDSASGLNGEDTAPRLMGRFAWDSLNPLKGGIRTYGRDPAHILTYVSRLLGNMRRNRGSNLTEIRAITRSDIDGDPLRRLRAHGVVVRALSAHADPVFPVELVHQHIALDERDKQGRLISIGNVDSYAERSYENAAHGSLLFKSRRLGLGAMPVLQLLEGFKPQRNLGDLAAELARSRQQGARRLRLAIAAGAAITLATVSALLGASSGAEHGLLTKLFGVSGAETGGSIAHIPTGGESNPPLTGTEGFHPPVVDPSGGVTGGEVAHTPTTTIVAGEGQTVWQNFANVFGADQAMAKIMQAGNAYAADPTHSGVTFGMDQGSGAVYFDVNGTRIWDAAEITKMLASAL